MPAHSAQCFQLKKILSNNVSHTIYRLDSIFCKITSKITLEFKDFLENKCEKTLDNYLFL